ncbi:hypothetical protein L596_026635 [Steinernema carpocapsae]|uniref:SCP domain-containing protein n=1 Tax=Steinernema carpocapsae TaxID=34508 RepID=A0A4U5M1Y1_STECR|nr:hypothetical protein L596_026635 [Steinernema carpocapsae]
MNLLALLLICLLCFHQLHAMTLRHTMDIHAFERRYGRAQRYATRALRPRFIHQSPRVAPEPLRVSHVTNDADVENGPVQFSSWWDIAAKNKMW